MFTMMRLAKLTMAFNQFKSLAIYMWSVYERLSQASTNIQIILLEENHFKVFCCVYCEDTNRLMRVQCIYVCVVYVYIS